MKRALAFAVVVALAAAALFLAQRRSVPDAVSPNAMVDTAADLQRDATRAPMHATRLSDDEETRIGDQLAACYERQQPALDAESKALLSKAQKVGGRLASHARRKLGYRFHVIASPQMINAFALPGGHVFIGVGLLDRLTSEDELAFILGHEIEHIDHYHAAERVQVEAKLRHLNLEIVAALSQLPLELWQAGYSKDEEFEADREGLRLASAAGYSPQGALRALEMLAKLHREYVIRAETPVGELSQVALQGLLGYFRSHPLPSERLAQARTIIAQDRLTADQPLTPLHLEYEITGAEKSP